jgi:hypothetical protein
MRIIWWKFFENQFNSKFPFIGKKAKQLILLLNIEKKATESVLFKKILSRIEFKVLINFKIDSKKWITPRIALLSVS